MVLSYLFDAGAIHKFFFFLSQAEGNLLKRCLELLILTFITYMILSEYSRNPKREYKYLILAFTAMMARQLVMIPVFFSLVFSASPFTKYHTIIPIMDHTLEAIALMIIAIAFIYPLYQKKNQKIQGIMSISLSIILLIGIGVYTLTKLTHPPFSDFKLHSAFGAATLMILKIIILLIPVYVFLFKCNTNQIRYRHRVAISFMLYMIQPIIVLVSYLKDGLLIGTLEAAQQPFPILSIMLFMTVVYNRLADKVYLKTKLEQSEKMIAHEKELNKMKDGFISTVSHELRTPITSIKLYLALMQEGRFGKLPKKMGQAIDIICNETSRLKVLIDDLLALNRLESGKSTIISSKFQLHEIIDELYINTAIEKGVNVHNKIPHSFFVNADKDKVKQVYVNLFNNALTHTESGGTISISASRRKDFWEFHVTDTGQGIPQEKLNKLFDKFYQVEDHMTRSKQGSGLGLAIVKSIAELHKGSVSVESEVDKGSKFSVRFANMD